MTPELLKNYLYPSVAALAALAFIGFGLWKGDMEKAMIGIAILAPGVTPSKK